MSLLVAQRYHEEVCTTRIDVIDDVIPIISLVSRTQESHPNNISPLRLLFRTCAAVFATPSAPPNRDIFNGCALVCSVLSASNNRRHAIRRTKTAQMQSFPKVSIQLADYQRVETRESNGERVARGGGCIRRT